MCPEETVDICNQIKKSTARDFINEGIQMLFGQLPLVSHDVTATTVWRARKTDEAHPSGFENITDVIHPPAQYAKAGRLNTEGSPVLYATVSNHGCLAEIHAAPGDRVQVSAFTLQPEQKLHCGYIGEIVKAHKGYSEDFSQVQQILAPYTEDQKTSIFLTDSFFAEILADSQAKQNNYLHTTALADVIRNGKNNLDAIVYPGVESSGAKNYAIHCDAVLKFNIPDMYLVEITKKHSYGFYEWKTLRQRKCYDNGRIIWKDL